MNENVVEKLNKYAEIVSVLEQNNISFNGLIDGLIQTYHKDNPEYILKQNPDWWDISSKEEVIDSGISAFSKQN